jgi:hypothetical protein
MNRGLLTLLVAGLFVSGSALRAQEQQDPDVDTTDDMQEVSQNTPSMANSAEPPKVLRIYREEMKPGKGAVHEKVEAGYVRALSKTSWPIHYIGMSALSGPSEAWFMEAHDSFASIEKEEMDVEKMPELKAELAALDEQDGDLRTGGIGVIAVYQPDLSFHAAHIGDSLPKDRYMSVLTLHIKPGQDATFQQAARIVLDADEKAGLDEPVLTYMVTSGMSGGTYLLFYPLRSLDYYDSSPMRSKKVHEAMGDKMAEFETLVGQSISGSESSIFSLSPRMSYVSSEFAAADPDFWNPKGEAPVTAENPATTAEMPAEEEE